jgi:ABC-type Fe3+-siderophore transport system permease subunit
MVNEENIMMKRKILGVSSLAWIITIAIVLLFVLMFMFDIVFYIVMGAIGISLALLVIYFIALGVDCMIH